MTNKEFIAADNGAAQEFINGLTVVQILALYNQITGSKVKKFADRGEAVRNLWKARKKMRSEKLPVAEVPVSEVLKQDLQQEQLDADKRQLGVVDPKPAKSRAQDNRIIHLVSQINPKRKGSASFDRFELYVDGMTVSEALAAGVRRDDIKWDTEHKLISLEIPDQA